MGYSTPQANHLDYWRIGNPFCSYSCCHLEIAPDTPASTFLNRPMIGRARVSVVAGRPRVALCGFLNAIPVWVSGLGMTAIFLCRPYQLTLTVPRATML